MESDKDSGDITRTDSVVTFLEGDYRSSTISEDGFEFRMRLPKRFDHGDGRSIDMSEVPEGGSLIKLDSGTEGVLMNNWAPGDDDRFHIVVIFRPSDPWLRQQLTIFADGREASTKTFRSGDVLYRTIDAEEIAFRPGEAFVERPSTFINRGERRVE